MKYFKDTNLKKLDYLLLLSMSLLICVGLYCVRQAYLFSEDMEGIFTKQLMGVIIGLGATFLILFIDYRFICKMSFLLYFGIIAILTLTLLFGTNINNVKRWTTIAGIPFQPSELTKVVLILFLAFLCNNYKEKLGQLYVFFILSIVTALPVLLIILEPHLSSCLSILFIFCIIVYSSGISYKVIGLVLAIILPIILGILIGITCFNLKLPFIQHYMVGRVLTFMSTDEIEDTTGKYQQNQAINAIMSGGVHGKMILGNDSTREYKYIYAKESDFVFSIVGEEFGFIGSSLIILLYIIIILRCLIISAHAPDFMGKLICIGVSALFIFQVFINVGVATSLLPNTGLPLPFISYGLTSLISSMAAIGLVLNIGLRQTKQSL